MPPYQPKPISLDSQVILRSDIGLGEAYMDGLFHSDDLLQLLNLLSQASCAPEAKASTAWTLQRRHTAVSNSCAHRPVSAKWWGTRQGLEKRSGPASADRRRVGAGACRGRPLQDRGAVSRRKIGFPGL